MADTWVEGLSNRSRSGLSWVPSEDGITLFMHTDRFVCLAYFKKSLSSSFSYDLWWLDSDADSPYAYLALSIASASTLPVKGEYIYPGYFAQVDEKMDDSYWKTVEENLMGTLYSRRLSILTEEATQIRSDLHLTRVSKSSPWTIYGSWQNHYFGFHCDDNSTALRMGTSERTEPLWEVGISFKFLPSGWETSPYLVELHRKFFNEFSSVTTEDVIRLLEALILDVTTRIPDPVA